MTSAQIRLAWFAFMLLAIPIINLVPRWPVFLTAHAAFLSSLLIWTGLTIRGLRGTNDIDQVRSFQRVFLGLLISLLMSLFF